MVGIPDLQMLRDRLIGRPIGGGSVIVPSHERAIGHHAVAWVGGEGQDLHPIWATLLGLRGMDLSFEDLFALAEGSAEDGIFFGEAAIEMKSELKAETYYQVSGEITDLVRRSGKKFDCFDSLTFRLDLSAADGTIVASATNSFLFVRKEEP